MKKSNSYLLLMFVLTVCIINLSNCKKDCNDPSNPNCSNFDPCLNVADASFTVKQYCSTFYNQASFEEDSLLTPGQVIFEVNDQDVDSCYWKIGAEAQYRTGKSILITFDNQMEELLPVQLIVYKNLECCQDQLAQRDTIIRYIPLEHREGTRIIGSYTGYHEDAPNDTFTITIDSMSHPYDNYTMFSVFNLPEGCFVNSTIFPYQNFRDQPSILPSKTHLLLFTGFSSDECPDPEGIGKVDLINNSIVIDYNISSRMIDTTTNTIPRINKKFIGQKN